jgi:hypothetical protein
MQRRPPAVANPGWIVGLFAAIFCPSCQQAPEPGKRGHLPDPPAARRAVETALGQWHDAPPTDLTTPAIRPVMFVDQQRRPGRPLSGFAILGESEADGALRFRVKLSLADPDESLLVDYYVFGQDPTWVYRAEDFDMIMHMDKSMMSTPESPGPDADAAGGGEEPKAETGPSDVGPPREDRPAQIEDLDRADR